MKRPSRNTKLLTTLATFTLCVFTISAPQGRATNTRAEDEAVIRESVRQMEAGWNTKSGSLFAKPFAADADFVVINGMHIKGREAIERGHNEIFTTIFKNTSISLKVKQIRFLRPDVAVVHVSGHRDAPESEKQFITDALITMVMTKDKDGWKIVAFQNTQVIANPR